MKACLHLKEFRFSKRKKNVTADTIMDLAETFLQNHIFQFNKRTLMQKRGSAIGNKFTSPHSKYLW